LIFIAAKDRGRVHLRPALHTSFRYV